MTLLISKTAYLDAKEKMILKRANNFIYFA